jgi:hypothetical protein
VHGVTTPQHDPKRRRRALGPVQISGDVPRSVHMCDVRHQEAMSTHVIIERAM